MNTSNATPEIIRLNKVKRLTGLSKSTLYAEIKAGRFPKQIQLTSKRCVGWVASEINSHIEARIAASRSTTNGGV